MDKTTEQLARLTATAQRLTESGDPANAAAARATLGVLVPVVKWLRVEQAIGGNPGAALEALTDAIARGLVMVADLATPEGQDRMVGVRAMLERIHAEAHNYSETHDERLERTRP
jgi:hypothetical protein